jgi:hypothetical protein
MDKRLATIGKRLFKESTRKAPQAEAEEEAPAKRSSARKQAGGESASRTPNGRQASGRQSAQASNAQASKKSASGKANRTASKSESATKGRNSNGRTTNGSGHSSNTTTDPEEIRRWAEERGGQPACVMGTGGKGDIGLLRLEFPGTPNANDDKLTPISWEDFFEKFEERGLALVYQEQTAEGERSNFNKIVSREPENEAKTGSGSGRSRSSR